MDGDSKVQLKPIPLPRKTNKNVETGAREGRNSLNELSSSIKSTKETSSSDINSNIDNPMDRKPNLTKFSSSASSSSPSNTSSPASTSPSLLRSSPKPQIPGKPVPLPRRFVKSNGTAISNVLPDLTCVSSAPHSLTGSGGGGSIKSGDFEDDDIDYENIPSHPRLLQQPEGDKNLQKRSTINLFKRDVGDPFEDDPFDTFKDAQPLSGITFSSPLEDLDEAARARLSASSMCSSATTASKESSTSECSDHYMEPPPARPLPDFARWSSGSGGNPHHFNTVPSKPKRSPHIALPRLSSLEEDQVLNSSPPRSSSPRVASVVSETDSCYEPIAPYPPKFHTISSTKHAIKTRSNLHKTGLSGSFENNFSKFNQNAGDDASTLPVNNNFSNSKRATVPPNFEKSPKLTNHQNQIENHHSLNIGGGSVSKLARNFDAGKYDVGDFQKGFKKEEEKAKRSSVPTPPPSSFYSTLATVNGTGNQKRRSLSSSLSHPPELDGEGVRGSGASNVILRRHSSGKSSTSSSSGGHRNSSKRDSLKNKVHEYDEVAIEDGNVIVLDETDSRRTSSKLNNNSISNFNSRNSVVQEFDPLFGTRDHGSGFPDTGAPLDLNDQQQHRYEYIDTDGDEDNERVSGDGRGGASSSAGDENCSNEDSPIPSSRGRVPYHCIDNPAYSPVTPRHSREIKTIDETYEPISPNREGISPKLSPKPKMGTRILRKTGELSPPGPTEIDSPPSPPSPPQPPPHLGEDEARVSMQASDSLNNLLSVPGAPSNSSSSQGNFFRKFSSKFRLNSIREEKDSNKSFESLLGEDNYGSLTTPCKKCSEPHPDTTKCKFAPIYRDNIVYSSHLYKTSGLSKKEFSKKWAVLAKAKLTFYNEKKDVISEIPFEKFLVVAKKNEQKLNQNQSDLKCFELVLSGGKSSSFVFASEKEGERGAWMQKFIEVHTSAFPSTVLSNFDRGGWCFIKETVTSDWRPCWLLLKERELYYSYWKSEESYTMDLRKARSVVLSQKDGEYKCPYIDNGDVLTIDFVCKKLLFIQTESSKVTSSWEKMIKSNAAFNGSEFHEMQLTQDNVPVIVEKCIDFVYAHGIRSEGIYRQSGSNTRITQLLQDFKNDAWSVPMSHKEFSAHDVAGTLKRFFRTLPEPLVTINLYKEWIKAASIKGSDAKMKEYIRLLEELPEINFNIMKKLIGHLYAVHELQTNNLMPLINLAPIWGPTLMNVDSSKIASSYEIACLECEVVKDLIENYHVLFKVDPEEIEREKKMKDALEIFHDGSSKRKASGDMKIWIYVWEKDEADYPPINVTLTPTSTAHTVIQQICTLNKIVNADNLSIHEVIFNEKLERPLHPSEKVINTVLRWSAWESEEERKSNYLILKPNSLYPSLIHYAKEANTMFGELKYADSKSKSFRKFAFQFSQACLKYYKDSKSQSELGSWQIEEIIWYLGCEPKRSPPTKWTFTFVKRHYPFKRSRDEPFFGNVISCGSEDELHKWIGAMIIGAHPEGLNPILVQ